MVAAVCNGRQAGGGQQLAPQAMIDDGLLDVVGLRNFPTSALAQVLREITETPVDTEYVIRFKVPWVEWESSDAFPINLDGEPIAVERIRFDVIPGAIRLVLPVNSPVVSS